MSNTEIFAFEMNEQTGISIGIQRFPSMAFAEAFSPKVGHVLVLFNDLLGRPEDYETVLIGDQVAFQPVTVDPERVLLLAKIRKWERVKQIRAERLAAMIEVPGIGIFQTDDESRKKFGESAAAAVAAIVLGISTGWTKRWTMADETRRDLTAMQMANIQQAWATYLDDVQNYSQDLRDLINGCLTPEAVEAVDIEADWPSNILSV